MTERPRSRKPIPGPALTSADLLVRQLLGQAANVADDPLRQILIANSKPEEENRP